MKRISLSLPLFFVTLMAMGQPASGYYTSAEGLKERSLKSAISEIISVQTVNSYNYLWTLFRTSDVRPDGKVWGMYSNCVFTFGTDQCGNYSQICDCYNREHIVPQSWFNEKSPMVSDGFHIYPTDGKVNALRSNYPHGETNSAALGGAALGSLGPSSVAGYTGTVYEPADEYKGDIARTYFYFVTRYESELMTMNGTVLTTSAYPGLTTWFLNLMLKWHREDPVSQKELDRNNAVYVAQLNRNPFIDYPDLVEHIWGNQKTVNWYANGNSLEEALPKAEIGLWPLPAKDYVKITGLEHTAFNYKIITITGTVLNCDYCPYADEITIGHLSAGIYLLQIETNAHKYILKLIIEN